MPLFDYECKCGEKTERITRNGEKVFCACGAEMEKVFSGQFGISMGVGPYGYYDENLQAYVGTNAEKKRIMAEQGVHESYGKGWI